MAWVIVLISGSKGGTETFVYGPYRNKERADKDALRAYDSGSDVMSADVIDLKGISDLVEGCKDGERYLREIEADNA